MGDFMRRVLIGLASLALVCGAVRASSDIEKTSALNGSQYAVIAPVYDGSGGSQSFIRLFNGNATTTTTYSITVVNASNGITLGSASIQVPAHASLQYPLTS